MYASLAPPTLFILLRDTRYDSPEDAVVVLTFVKLENIQLLKLILPSACATAIFSTVIPVSILPDGTPKLQSLKSTLFTDGCVLSPTNP